VVAAHTDTWWRNTNGVSSSAAKKLALHKLWGCSSRRSNDFFPSGKP
jgi:hypothetical protein